MEATSKNIAHIGVLSLSNKISINEKIAYTNIDQDLVVMSQDGLYYGINETGAKIWELLETKTQSLQTIYDYMQIKYAVGKKQCLDELKKFISDLAAKKIIVITP